MQFKSILAAAAVAVAATVGSASAADRFVTLDGIAAVPMPAPALDEVRGGIIAITGFPLPSLEDGEHGVEDLILILIEDSSLRIDALVPPDFDVDVSVLIGDGPTK